MGNTILIVDENLANRNMLSGILGTDYAVITATNRKDAVAILENESEKIGMVLIDLKVDDDCGISVLDEMKERGFAEKVPVLVIGDEKDVERETLCFEHGVSDFIHKPFDNTLVKKRVANVYNLFRYKSELEEKVSQQTETLRQQFNQLRAQSDKLKRTNEHIIDILGAVVEGRDAESGEHIKRVKGFTGILAREVMRLYPEYELNDEKIEIIVKTSALHDIGKIAISDAILLKPARLTPEEFEIMKTHTLRGDEILDYLEDVWDDSYQQTARDICRYHHEKYDGKGYPCGLVGDQIPISAQIVSLADVYDALVSIRVYKRSFTKEEAFNMIMEGACGTFSPKILQCFINVRKQFEQIGEV
jgi:putative two-component system response regulator